MQHYSIQILLLKITHVPMLFIRNFSSCPPEGRRNICGPNLNAASLHKFLLVGEGLSVIQLDVDTEDKLGWRWDYRAFHWHYNDGRGWSLVIGVGQQIGCRDVGDPTRQCVYSVIKSRAQFSTSF